MKYAELYWVALPDRAGREQRGRRPAIIWQDTETHQFPTVIIIPLSAQLNALRFGATLLINPTATNGLLTPSVALAFQLGACDTRRIGDHLGELDSADLAALRELSKKLLRLE